jgi:hypothetical protein
VSQLLALLLSEKAGMGMADNVKATSELEGFAKNLVEKARAAQTQEADAGAGATADEFAQLVEREMGKL